MSDVHPHSVAMTAVVKLPQLIVSLRVNKSETDAAFIGKKKKTQITLS